MRSTALLFAGMIALAAACGGKTSGVGNPGGGGSSGSGSSSSGGSSGSSSGGISSSSGSVSSSSGTNPTCAPLPGCTSSVECPDPTGCGGSCYCEGGQWECADPGCGDDVADAGPPDSSETCPPNPPPPGTACFEDGFSCGYAGSGGGSCGESCDCANGSWECVAPPCPPPTCPSAAPQPDTACADIGASCDYTSNACFEQCDCNPSGSWSCFIGTCIDAGAPDTGIEDASSVCPVFQPQDGQACSDESAVCSYFDGSGCATNCLCASTGWVCAAQQGC